jgi:hypothetical protein
MNACPGNLGRETAFEWQAICPVRWRDRACAHRVRWSLPVFDRLSLAFAEVDLYRKCERARSAHLRTLSPIAYAATEYRLLPRAEQKYRRAVRLAAIQKTGGSRAGPSAAASGRPGGLHLRAVRVGLATRPLPPRPTRSSGFTPASDGDRAGRRSARRCPNHVLFRRRFSRVRSATTSLWARASTRSSLTWVSSPSGRCLPADDDGLHDGQTGQSLQSARRCRAALRTRTRSFAIRQRRHPVEQNSGIARFSPSRFRASGRDARGRADDPGPSRRRWMFAIISSEGTMPRESRWGRSEAENGAYAPEEA